jgi:hypothetical protein
MDLNHARLPIPPRGQTALSKLSAYGLTVACIITAADGFGQWQFRIIFFRCLSIHGSTAAHQEQAGNRKKAPYIGEDVRRFF